MLIYCIGDFLSDLRHLCIKDSSFSQLIRTDSNAFFLIAEYMQVRKQQLEVDVEQQTGSK